MFTLSCQTILPMQFLFQAKIRTLVMIKMDEKYMEERKCGKSETGLHDS